MPISLSGLNKQERTFTFEYDGEQAEITYLVKYYTPIMERQAHEKLDEQMPASSIALILAKLLVAWDVTGKDGKALDVRYETLEQFPFDFLAALMNAITDDQKAGLEDRKNSDGGSARKARSANARRGTR
jgi:hypothetical protein